MFDLKTLTGFHPSLAAELANELMVTNDDALDYGLQLSPQQALEIIESRNITLANYHRFEMDSEVLKKIINAFYASPYLQQHEYAQTISDLHELFHHIKNELNDEIGDDQLISYLSTAFDQSCHGDLKLLMGRETENLIREYHFKGIEEASQPLLDEGPLPEEEE